MIKSDLSVLFHTSSFEDQSLMEHLAHETRRLDPDAVSIMTTREMKIYDAHSGLRDTVFNRSAQGVDAAETVRIARRMRSHKRMAVVTLCPDMMKAANDAGISIVTMHQPVEPVRPALIAGKPSDLGAILRGIPYPENA